MSKRRLVVVVDDSESVRESLPDLLSQPDVEIKTFESAEAFLDAGVAAETDAMILDVGLPGMSGPELQLELSRRGHRIPIVFITAQGDKSLPQLLISRGAVACLFKPFSDDALLEALAAAFGRR